MTQVQVSSIVVGPRHRKDLGDIAGLAASIEELGQLQPIVLDNGKRLIIGTRRLEAVKRLGRSFIDAVVVEGLDDAVKALKAERAENTCRKDFTPTEAVAIGRAIEEALRPLAAERARSRTDLGGKLPPSPVAETGKVRDAAAEAAGMSPRTYAKAKAVIEATEDPDPAVAAVATEAAEEMDHTRKVDGAYKKVQAASRRQQDRILQGKGGAVSVERREQIRRLAAEGYGSRQIAERVGVTTGQSVRQIAKGMGVSIVADEVLGRRKALDSSRIVEETVNTVRGIGTLLDHVNYSELDASLIKEWVDSLTDAITALVNLKRNLKETTHDTA